MVGFNCFAYLGTSGDDFVWNFFFIAFSFIYSMCSCLFVWGVLTAVPMWESEDELLDLLSLSTVWEMESKLTLSAWWQTSLPSELSPRTPGPLLRDGFRRACRSLSGAWQSSMAAVLNLPNAVTP